MNDNGVISLGSRFHFWQPELFGSNPNSEIQGTNVFAPYWADVDIRFKGYMIIVVYMIVVMC